MTTYYVDPDSVGTPDGLDWDTAWLSLQDAFDTVAADDTTYCRGTETLSAPLDIDQGNDGTDNAPISFVGCNSSGVEDGTRYEIDATSAGAGEAGIKGIVAGSGDYWRWRNIRVHHAPGNGWRLTGSGYTAYNKFINCEADNNGGIGFSYYYGPSMHFIFCSSHDNTGDGFSSNWHNVSYRFCESYNNTADGYGGSISAGSSYYHCISCGNLDGIGNWDVAAIVGCIIDGNLDNGIQGFTGSENHANLFIGNRITNNTNYGIDNLVTNELSMYGWNFFEGNGTDIHYPMSPIVDPITQIDSNVFTGTIGYVSADSPDYDYELTPSATLRNQATPIGGLNGSTNIYLAAGLPVEDLGGGEGDGGSFIMPQRSNSLLRR